MILLGEGTMYVDGVEIGGVSSVCIESNEAASVYVEPKGDVLPQHFKSVKLNGEELISVDERK